MIALVVDKCNEKFRRDLACDSQCVVPIRFKFSLIRDRQNGKKPRLPRVLNRGVQRILVFVIPIVREQYQFILLAESPYIPVVHCRRKIEIGKSRERDFGFIENRHQPQFIDEAHKRRQQTLDVDVDKKTGHFAFRRLGFGFLRQPIAK